MKSLHNPFIIIAVAILLLFPSCRRTSDNGKIDGLWRIDTIEYFEPGQTPSTIHPEGFLIAVQLELLQLDNQNPVATAIISYSKGDKSIGLDFPYNPDPELLRKFGIMENPCVLQIETLNSRHLVLASSSSRVRCTRF